MPTLGCREFNFSCNSPQPSHTTDTYITDVRFYVRVVEFFSGVDVDDMLQLRKEKQVVFLLLLFVFLHAFA